MLSKSLPPVSALPTMSADQLYSVMFDTDGCYNYAYAHQSDAYRAEVRKAFGKAIQASKRAA